MCVFFNLNLVLHRADPFPSFLQTSLTKLLETLNRAEPFFIRCIRSNAEKVRLCHVE